MNEFMYKLYTLTKNQKHLEMAHLFDLPEFLGPLALNQDMLTTLHANKHIPIVLGAAKRYEVIGDEMYKNIALNFWDIIYHTRTYATGGSNGGNGTVNATLEHWGEPNRLLSSLWNNNQEFCTQYAMMKLIRYLIRWTGDTKFSDHYEKAYFNGILGNQKPNTPGVMTYFTPLGMGFSKADNKDGVHLLTLFGAVMRLE
jgi:DUF1680 family protein